MGWGPPWWVVLDEQPVGCGREALVLDIWRGVGTGAAGQAFGGCVSVDTR